MFANRRTKLLLNRCMLVMLLFAQSLYAAQPCEMPVHEPEMAFNDMAGMDCEKMGSPNTCLQHCTAGDQTSGQAQVAVAEMPALVVLIVPVAIDCAATLPDAATSVSHSPDPPPSIRFCSFQL